MKTFCAVAGLESCLLLAASDGLAGTWSKLYGDGTVRDVGNDITLLTSADLVAVGASGGTTLSPNDGLVIKTTIDGDPITQFRIGGSASDELARVIALSDGGFATIGTTRSFGAGGSDIWVSRFDAAGSVVWSKTLGTAFDDRGEAITTLVDGSLAVCGKVGGSGSFPDNAYVAKLDADGAVVWQREFDGGDHLGDQCRAVLGLASGDIAIGGYLDYGHNGAAAWLATLDSSGAIVWQRSFRRTLDWLHVLRRLAETPGGQIVALGQGRFDDYAEPLLVRVTASGTVLLSNNYLISGTTGGVENVGMGLALTADGEVIVGQQYLESNTPTLSVPQLMKLDSQGVMTIRKRYSSGQQRNGSVQSLLVTGDGTVIACGYDGDGPGDLMIMRLTPQLSILSGCEQPASPVNGSQRPQETNQASPVTTSLAVANAAPTIWPFTTAVAWVCDGGDTIDGDGVPSAIDNCPTVPNRDQGNSDNDPAGNACDCARSDPSVYPGAPQFCDGVNSDCSDPNWPAAPGEADADADSYRLCNGDCDDTNAQRNPGQTEACNGFDDDCNLQIDEDADGEDSDLDAVGNLCDNCRFVQNPSQANSDADSLGDACDNCLTQPNDDQVNSDEDPLGDACDNCDLYPSLNQADGDGDSVGDVCDNCPAIVNTGQSDDDSDEVGNSCDNCIAVSNRNQRDANTDGEGDNCDLNDGIVLITKVQRQRVDWQGDPAYPRYNLYRGSLAVLRATGLYTQAPGSNPYAGRGCGIPFTFANDTIEPAGGEALYYLVTGKPAIGPESPLGAGDDVNRPNNNPCP